MSEPISEAQSRRGVVGRNVVVLLASQVITWGLAIVVTVAEPRFLGPDGVGQLRLGASVWAIATIFAELGTGTLLTLQFARDAPSATALVRPVFVLRLMAMAVSAAAVITFAVIAYHVNTTVTVVLVGIDLTIFMLSNIARDSLYGMQLMGPTAVADIATKVVRVVVVVGVLVAGGGPRSVAIVLIIPSVVSFMMLWRALRRRTGEFPDIAHPSERVTKAAVLRMSAPFLLGSAIQVVYSSIDVITISLMATVDEVGWYSSAAMLFGTLLFVPTTLMTSLFPALAQLHEESPESAEHLLGRVVRSSLPIAMPIGLGTIVIAEQLCVLLLGEDFRPSGEVLAVFGCVLIVMFQTILLGRYAFAIGRHRVFNMTMIAMTVLTIPLDIVFVPWARDQFENGAIGGAMTYVITESLVLVVIGAKLAPRVFDRALSMRLVKCSMCGVALMAAAWPLRDEFIVVPIVAGAAAYLTALVLLRVLDADERQMLSRLVHKVRRRLVPGRA